MSRRAVLRLALVGGSVPVVAGLLAACGGSSSSPTSAATTAATSSSGSGSATQAAATSTPAASASATGAATTTATQAASAPSATSSSAGNAFTAEPAKNKGGQVISGNASDAQTLSTIHSHDTSSGAIINQIFEGLTEGDPSNAQPVGRLAQKWDITTDGTGYTFTLNDGVNWQDGQPLTSGDVTFTYDLFLNPDTSSPRTSTLAAHIAKVEAPDASHIVFTLKQPVASFLINDAGYGIVPQHILKDVAPKDLEQSDFSTGKKGVTIGTGPFMFDEWVKDDHTTLVKNPKYWRGAPNLDKWIYKVVPNSTVLGQQLKTGEIDYASVDPSDVADLQKTPSLTVKIYDTFSCTFWCYQLDPSKTEVFQDKAVRQALLYALDRKAMIDAINFGYGTLAIGTIPPISWAYNPDAIQLKYPYDIDKANQLLDQAGWTKGSDGVRAKGGKKLSFTILSSPQNQIWPQYIQVFQQQWQKLGVEVKVSMIEWTAFLDTISKQKNFDLFFEGFSWGPDPDQTAWFSSDSQNGGLNRGSYSNPQVDKLLQEGLAATDQAKRKELYTQMENIVMDDLPYVVLYFNKGTVGVNNRVHNYFPNAVNSSFNSYQWWVDA